MTLECLSYHATAALEDAVKLSRRKIPSAAALKLHSFSFDDFSLNDEETLQVSQWQCDKRLGCVISAHVSTYLYI